MTKYKQEQRQKEVKRFAKGPKANWGSGIVSGKSRSCKAGLLHRQISAGGKGSLSSIPEEGHCMVVTALQNLPHSTNRTAELYALSILQTLYCGNQERKRWM